MSELSITGFGRNPVRIQDARDFDRGVFDILSELHFRGDSRTLDHNYTELFLAGDGASARKLVYITVPDPFSLDVEEEESFNHMNLVIVNPGDRRVINEIEEYATTKGYVEIPLIEIIPLIIGSARNHAYLEYLRTQTPA